MDVVANPRARRRHACKSTCGRHPDGDGDPDRIVQACELVSNAVSSHRRALRVGHGFGLRPHGQSRLPITARASHRELNRLFASSAGRQLVVAPQGRHRLGGNHQGSLEHTRQDLRRQRAQGHALLVYATDGDRRRSRVAAPSSPTTTVRHACRSSLLVWTMTMISGR